MYFIEKEVDLLPFNTFQVSAQARFFCRVKSVESFQELQQSDIYRSEKHLILGGGSNILFTGAFNGLIVKTELAGIQVIKETDDHVWIKVGAGENWHNLVMHCLSNNWGGLENLSLIPGTVGAAPLQNIGAYGVEIKEHVVEVETIELTTGKVNIFTNSDCHFGYRESIFKKSQKNFHLISSVTLILSKRNHPLVTTYGVLKETMKKLNLHDETIDNISRAVIHIRQSKLPDPKEIGNAGSFFKNPVVLEKQFDELKKTFPEIPGYPSENQEVKIAAAWLIEQCGWKGKTVGHVGVHKQQALVLVNNGRGSGEEIVALSKQIEHDVEVKFGVTLSPEVNII